MDLAPPRRFVGVIVVVLVGTVVIFSLRRTRIMSEKQPSAFVKAAEPFVCGGAAASFASVSFLTFLYLK